jgi:hypothetical protein
MEKVIHIHLDRVRPVRPPAPKRARTHDCTCQHAKDKLAAKDRRAKDEAEDKKAQDARDQESAREMAGLEKHEWNALSSEKRAEWIRKFKAKHPGDSKAKDADVREMFENAQNSTDISRATALYNKLLDAGQEPFNPGEFKRLQVAAKERVSANQVTNRSAAEMRTSRIMSYLSTPQIRR